MTINDKMPKLISIGYRTYEVTPLEMADHEMTEKYGWCDKANCNIYVYTGGEAMVVADTLLHEVLHAVWAHMGLDDKHEEEAVVNRLSTGLSTVMYDNPDLVDFIKYCIDYTQSDEDEDGDGVTTFEFSTKTKK